MNNQTPKGWTPANRRFLTVELYAGDILAFSDPEFRKACDSDNDPIDDANVACWVWQWAPDAATAIGQHHAKFEEWEQDSNAGRPIKDTY